MYFFLILYFRNLFWLSIQTSMQNFGLLAQKLSELLLILYWGTSPHSPPHPPPVTKLPVELCTSPQLIMVFGWFFPRPIKDYRLKDEKVSWLFKQWASEEIINHCLWPRLIIFSLAHCSNNQPPFSSIILIIFWNS